MIDWSDLPRRHWGDKIAYHEAGTGPDVILVHGVGLRLESWRAQIDALSATHRVLAVDQPGHGESPALAASTPSVQDLADGLAGFMRAQAEQPCIVIGHSLGALIAIDLAIRHAPLIRAIAALTPVFERSDEAFATVTARAAWLPSASDDEVAEMPIPRWFGDATDTATLAIANACRGWLRRGDRAGYVAAYRAFAGTRGPQRSAVHQIACPALFFTAGHDPNSTPAMARELARLAPLGRSEVLHDARHMMQMTHPDEVNRRLLAFIDACAR